MMELKTIYGDVIIALQTAKTIAELVSAAIEAKKSLSGHIWLRTAGQMELDFDMRDLALFSDLMGGAA